MADYRLSIVIPSHNQPELLRLCLHSIAEYQPAKVQVIVVDDGSPQGVVSQITNEFNFVDTIRNQQARGFCCAANQGIAAASAPIVQLLNDDTQVTAGWTNAPCKLFETPTIGAVAPLVFRGIPGTIQAPIDSAGDGYDLGGFAFKRGNGQPLNGEFLTRREVFGASASSAFYRTELIRRLGGFPENFGAYFEDVDLSWRIRHAGFQVMFEPESRIWHRVGSSYQKKRRLLERQSLNEERVFWRNVPRLRQSIPRHLAVLLGKSIRRAREGTLVPFLVGRLRILNEIGAISRHRQNVLSGSVTKPL